MPHTDVQTSSTALPAIRLAAGEPLTERDVQALGEAEAYVKAAGRKTTDETFELGRHMAAVVRILPQRTVDQWVKRHCGFTPRHARNFAAVYRELSDHRDRLVDYAVSPTVLFELTKANDEEMEAAFEIARRRREEGKQLRVQDVKKLLEAGDGDGAAEADPFDQCGSGGLKAMIDRKAKDGRAVFVANVNTIRRAFSNGLREAKAEKKRVKKNRLAPLVESPAHFAHDWLGSLCHGYAPRDAFRKYTTPVGFPAGSHWAHVERLLYKLRDNANWAPSERLEEWLVTEVEPVLSWAVTNEKDRKWPLAEEGVDVSADAAGPEADDVDAADERQAIAEVPGITPDADELADNALPADDGMAGEAERPSLTDETAPAAGLVKGFKRPVFLDKRKAEAFASEELASVAMQ